MRRAAFLLVALLAGCGDSGSGEDRPRPQPRVTGTVDLDRAAAGAPDAGTAAGHGGDAAVGATSAAAFSFTGRVEPAASAVTVSDGVVRSEPSGRFTVAIVSPRSGTKSVRVTAKRPGHVPWRIDVRVARGAPARVRVPARDDVAPSAAFLLEPDGGAPAVVRASPSLAGDRPGVVALPEPGFRATAVARDPRGTGRVRLSVVTQTRCGNSERRRMRYLPPAQIANVAIPPGARAPVERQRTEHVRLRVPPGCIVTGEAYAEATDARGRQAVTEHAGFRHPP